jgi:hypothetical protein
MPNPSTDTLAHNYTCTIHADLCQGTNITFEGSFYANMDLIILDGAPVKLGARILCGPRVGIYAATHSSKLCFSASDTLRSCTVSVVRGLFLHCTSTFVEVIPADHSQRTSMSAKEGTSAPTPLRWAMTVGSEAGLSSTPPPRSGKVARELEERS